MEEKTHKTQEGLKPLECDNTKILPEILILGSFPGIGSLESGEYYHEDNNKNRIWEVICEIYNDYPVPQIDEYDKKKALLARHRIVLWDYYKTAARKNPDSSDKSLVGIEHNDIIDYLKKHTTIKKVVINGKGKIYKAIEKEIKRDIENDSKLKNRGIEVFRLPSTNGLNTRYAKTLSRHWSALNSFLIKAPNGGIKGFGAPYCCPACERFSQTEKCQYCGSLCNIVMY